MTWALMIAFTRRENYSHLIPVDIVHATLKDGAGMIETATDLIDALGGTSAVAEQLGASQSAVSNWRNRGVPAWARLPLARECERRGLPVDPDLFDRRIGGALRECAE